MGLRHVNHFKHNEQKKTLNIQDTDSSGKNKKCSTSTYAKVKAYKANGGTIYPQQVSPFYFNYDSPNVPKGFTPCEVDSSCCRDNNTSKNLFKTVQKFFNK